MKKIITKKKIQLELIEEIIIDLNKLEHDRRNTADIEYIEGWDNAKEIFLQLLTIYKKEILK